MQSTEFGVDYLAYPDIFPGRICGDAVGVESVTIAFLGTKYCFRGLSGTQSAMLRNNYRTLCVESDQCGPLDTVETSVYKVNQNDFTEPDSRERFYSFDMWHEPEAIMVAGPGFMARFSRGNSMRGGLWLGQSDSLLEKLAFENYFRLLVSYRMLAQGGVLLHSAGVVQGDCAYLFVGHSGSGKSTISRLSSERGLHVLSDDLNAFIKTKRGYLVGKLPFSGSFERNMISDSSYPVAFLGYLQQGNNNLVDYKGLTTAEMVSKMVANSPFVNADPYSEEQLFDNVGAILEENQMAKVTFDLSGNIWDELHSLHDNQAPAVSM